MSKQPQSRRLISKMEFYKKANEIETRITALILNDLRVRKYVRSDIPDPLNPRHIVTLKSNANWLIMRKKTRIEKAATDLVIHTANIIAIHDSDIVAFDRKISSILKAIEACTELETLLGSVIKIFKPDFKYYGIILSLINQEQALLAGLYQSVISPTRIENKIPLARSIYMHTGVDLKELRITTRISPEELKTNVVQDPENIREQLFNSQLPNLVQKTVLENLDKTTRWPDPPTIQDIAREDLNLQVVDYFMDNPEDLLTRLDNKYNQYIWVKGKYTDQMEETAVQALRKEIEIYRQNLERARLNGYEMEFKESEAKRLTKIVEENQNKLDLKGLFPEFVKQNFKQLKKKLMMNEIDYKNIEFEDEDFDDGEDALLDMQTDSSRFFKDSDFEDKQFASQFELPKTYDAVGIIRAEEQVKPMVLKGPSVVKHEKNTKEDENADPFAGLI